MWGAWRRRLMTGRRAVASALGVVMLVTVCIPLAGTAPGTAAAATTTRAPGTSYAVAAQRQSLTTNAVSPVADDRRGGFSMRAPASRADQGQSPTHKLRASAGQHLRHRPRCPNQSAQAKPSCPIRSILSPPFVGGRIYYGGYDCNFYPADRTARVASSTLGCLHFSVSSKGRHS
jgi:hypothetical protein